MGIIFFSFMLIIFIFLASDIAVSLYFMDKTLPLKKFTEILKGIMYPLIFYFQAFIQWNGKFLFKIFPGFGLCAECGVICRFGSLFRRGGDIFGIIFLLSLDFFLNGCIFYQ